MKKIQAKTFVIKSFESLLVIGYILFEELIWNIFAKPIYQYFKNLVALDSLKKIFLEMNRYLLLSIFILILAITEVQGFAAGFFFLQGNIVTGFFVYISKIPVAAFTFWLFDLTKDKLMTFDWLKTAYQYIMDWIHKFVNSSIYIYIKARTTIVRENAKSILLKYFGKEGLIASVKSHYLVIKPYFVSYLKK
ncbi:MAG: hypothetical protein V3U87_05100 [Methylococcaceae bacterium]